MTNKKGYSYQFKSTFEFIIKKENIHSKFEGTLTEDILNLLEEFKKDIIFEWKSQEGKIVGESIEDEELELYSNDETNSIYLYKTFETFVYNLPYNDPDSFSRDVIINSIHPILKFNGGFNTTEGTLVKFETIPIENEI